MLNSSQVWVLEHSVELERMMVQTMGVREESDIKSIFDYFVRNPNIAQFLYEDYTTRYPVKIDFFKNFFLRSQLGVLLGKRGSGKTAVELRIAEFVHYCLGRPVVVYNVHGKLPEWIIQSDFFNKEPYSDVPNNAFVFHDECHYDINSKDWASKSNDELRKYLSTSRHRNICIMWSSQLASNISLDMIRYSDFSILKQLGIHRDKDRENFFELYNYFFRNWTQDKFVFDCGDHIFTLRNDLPSFWSDEISVGFASSEKKV